MHSRSIKSAAALLHANGVSLFRNASGEFQVRLCNSPRNAPYYFTDDLDDAVQTGLRMADERDAAEAAARDAAEAAFMAPHYTERMKLEFTLALKSAYTEAANA
jgi:hypothetical protein